MMMTTARRSFRHRGAARALAAACVAFGVLSASVRLTAQEPSPPPSPAGGLKITLKWTTASEVDNYGYFVHRGDTPDGPFTPMNKKAIPGAGNSDTPSQYLWEDHDVELGRTYYYYLESVSVQGTREKFSPVLSRTCCGATAQATPAPTPSPTPSPDGR